jgi:hypothetical protein
MLTEQRHIGMDRLEYKHNAQASVSGRKALTCLQFLLVLSAKIPRKSDRLSKKLILPKTSKRFTVLVGHSPNTRRINDVLPWM